MEVEGYEKSHGRSEGRLEVLAVPPHWGDKSRGYSYRITKIAVNI